MNEGISSASNAEDTAWQQPSAVSQSPSEQDGDSAVPLPDALTASSSGNAAATPRAKRTTTNRGKTYSAANRNKRAELTPYERGMVMGAYECSDKTISEISRILGFSRATIHNTINRAKDRQDGKSLPHPGRPRKCTEDEERRIADLAGNYENLTALREATGYAGSQRSLSRVLRRYNASTDAMKRDAINKLNKSSQKSAVNQSAKNGKRRSQDQAPVEAQPMDYQIDPELQLLQQLGNAHYDQGS